MAFRRSLVTLLSLLAAPLAAQQTPNELLSDVSRRVETIDRIPNYMCTQTVERKQYAPAVSQAGKSCADLAVQRKLRRLKMNLSSSDRLRLDVAASSVREMYSWVGQQTFSDRGLAALVNSGLTSTGAFNGLLKAIFGGVDHPEISYQSDVTDTGRRLFEFGFRVPLKNSHYAYGVGQMRVMVAYDGTFRLDPTTADLAQLVFRTSELPPETDACEVTQTIEYGRTRISDSDLLLPTQVQVQTVDRRGVESDNHSVYSNCHEFLGESTISFGDPGAPATTGAGNTGAAPENPIPVGLYFRVTLTAPINTATASTGDPVQGKLATDIRDAAGRIFARAGTIVNGRIAQMLFSYVLASNLAVAIRWESIVLGGKAEPFAATPLRTAAERNLNAENVRFRQGEFMKRVELGTANSETAARPVSNFTFNNAKPGYVIRPLESSWVTSAP